MHTPCLAGAPMCVSMQALADMLVRLNQEQRSTNLVPSEIESLIIIDRSTDLITPLRSQLTYEGLIDEIYGIDNSK
jgi:hypothetical protein